jgi:hypothetical protein
MQITRINSCLLTLALLLGFPLSVQAQRLYDQYRDEKAQQAKKLAEEVESADLFGKQLKNLTLISQQDFATIFLDARRTLRARLNSFDTWTDANELINKLKNRLGSAPAPDDAELENKLQDIKEEKEEAEETLSKLVEQATAQSDPSVMIWLERIGDLESILSFGRTLLDTNNKFSDGVKAADELLKGIDSIKKLYMSYQEKLTQIKNLDQELVALKIPLQKVALQNLQVDEEHLKNLTAIATRLVLEQGEIREMINEYEKLNAHYKELIPEGQDKIEAALNNAVAQRKIAEAESLAQSLHIVAALYAHGTTPANLAALRVAQERRRYSIKKSAVIARAYELHVLTGAKRLALYYKGGLKPEAIVQLIHSLATVAIPPAILTK